MQKKAGLWHFVAVVLLFVYSITIPDVTGKDVSFCVSPVPFYMDLISLAV